MFYPHRAPSMPHITFTFDDFKVIDLIQDDPLVINVQIINYMVRNTFIDEGSSANILFWNTFKQMDIPEIKILPHDGLLFNFT